MTGQEKIRCGYWVKIRPADTSDSYTVSYAPRGLQYARGEGGKPKRVPPDFQAQVEVQGDQYTVSWINPPKDPEVTQAEFEQDAVGRVRSLRQWVGFLVSTLMDPIRGWANELGWSHRQVEKLMKDEEIAHDYPVPGLLLQEGMVRIAVEPIGRSTPGAEAVVDLYLMPAYDDIASLYYYGGRWNLHYMAPETPAAATIREAPSKPLSKEALQEVLDLMKSHAA